MAERVSESSVRAFKTTDGTTLRGWHYLPQGSGKHATIVMAHDFSAVKEMYLDKYAKWFTETGAARPPSWRNEVTARTLEFGFGYEPDAYIVDLALGLAAAPFQAEAGLA